MSTNIKTPRDPRLSSQRHQRQDPARAQVITVFFASFIAGSFLNQIQQFASAPGTIVNVLGTAAPQSATFFMSYILLLGLTTKPLLFLRLPGAPCRPRFRAQCMDPETLKPITESATFFMSYILLLGLATKPLLFLRLPDAPRRLHSFAQCMDSETLKPSIESATFFMSYILLLGLTTKPLLFLRLPGAPRHLHSFARRMHRILPWKESRMGKKRCTPCRGCRPNLKCTGVTAHGSLHVSAFGIPMPLLA